MGWFLLKLYHELLFLVSENWWFCLFNFRFATYLISLYSLLVCSIGSLILKNEFLVSIDATFFIVQVMVMLFVTLLYLMLFVTVLAFFHWIFSSRERLGLSERRELRQLCACGCWGELTCQTMDWRMVNGYLIKVEWPLLPVMQGNQLRDGPLCLFNNVLVLRFAS